MDLQWWYCNTRGADDQEEKRENQWRIQGGGGGPAPAYFSTKMRPEGPKKKFWETGPPLIPYLRVWMTVPPPTLSDGLDPPLKGVLCSRF